MSSFNDDNRAIAIREVKRLRDLTTIKFDEHRLTQGINLMLKNLNEIVINFNFCVKSHEK